MATQAKEATAKGATATPSNESVLSDSAPPLRTAEQLLCKNEQIADGLERSVIKPKTAEQLSQCVKLPIKLAELELKMRNQIAKAGRKAPVLRSPLIRSMTPGLDPDRISSGDGAAVRALAPEN